MMLPSCPSRARCGVWEMSRDKCITRVKSVYDKRIVLDGTENWKMGVLFGDGGTFFCDLLNDHYQSGPIISSRIPPTNILTSNKNQGNRLLG